MAATEEAGRRILAILTCLVESSKHTESSIHATHASILSATVYLTLARIPGCSAFQFFHPVIFQKSIDVLKKFESLCRAGGKRRVRSKGSVGSTTSQKSQSQRRRKISQESECLFEESNAGLELSDHDCLRLQQHLTVLLQSLVAYLEYDSLKKDPHLSETVMNLLAWLTRIDPTSFAAGFNKEEQPWNVKSTCHLSYMSSKNNDQYFDEVNIHVQ
ncbi:condensin-2 complex subunit D3-L-like [Watersipora subatra]|uniref:condensin-2 complex subunit D3-L-like n=1 Tax=Watersipora subatra TaxID=2589382 RepID=UPI00355B4D64